ncbi:PTS sugar transporter subunit IIA [Pseudoleptotrichia goodfellowii]|uniref:PTS system mannitol/fructose-specific transporter subunit IIA n=1 Tax=Pseudoleptotrichia goodfellowii TaxID=157692 RepID=A0A510J7H8_9FUSO|nr:PTS sugar transporter subunit IIA [Pseudoleptotrichia goodfellowii]BBM35222.1 PTS system mannitol/fructose-specific transporter subunit IIA [Pseudoleptotrichia goodfellowii]
MKNFIDINNMVLDLETEDKNLIINKMVETILEKNLIDKEKFIRDVLKREETENTVVGFKVAIPHGKSEYIKSPQIVFAKLKKEIFWGDPEEKVKYIFLLGVPAASAGEHIEILMKLSKKILDGKFREKLENTNDKKELLKIILE